MLILPFSAKIEELNIKVFRALADEYLAILPAAKALKTSGGIAMGKEHPRFSARGRHEYDTRRDGELEVLYDSIPDECPFCHHRHFRKYGFIKSNHRRRYQCIECGHTVCGSFSTIYYRGRLDQREVRALADSIALGTTVRESAKAANVNKNTAMRYRKMILALVKNADKKPVLSGKGVQIDETYTTLYNMIGDEKKLRGISHQKEAISIGTDESNNIFLKDLGPGHPTCKNLSAVWEGHISQGSIITHDTLHGYRTAFDSSNPAEEIYVNSQIPEEEEQLDHINHLCSGIQWFLQRHKGIRKANLDSYLSWYEIMHNENPSLEKFESRIMGSMLQKRKILNINT